MGWFSRSALARALGVTPARVSQMQSEGTLARPVSVSAGLEVEAWPESYGSALVAARRGRATSKSVFALPPAEKQTAMEQPIVVELDDGVRAFALRFDREEFPIVLIQEVSQLKETAYRGVAPGRAYSRGLGFQRRTEQAIHAVAAEWFQRDPSLAAWIVVSYDSFEDDFTEVVVEPDDSPAPATSWGHSGHGRPEVPPYFVHQSPLSSAALEEKLGRKVPVFAPELITGEALEEWVRGGMKASTEIECDWTGQERAVNSAYLLHRMPGTPLRPRSGVFEEVEILEGCELITDEDREVLVGALLRKVDWSSSGQVPQLFLQWGPHYDRHGDEHQEIQLIPRMPRFGERYRSTLPTELAPPPQDPAAMQALADRVADTIAFYCGSSGASPSPELTHALKQALRSAIDELPLDDPASGRVAGRAPFSIRSWTSRSRPSALSQYERALVRMDGLDHPSLASRRYILLALEEYLADRVGCRGEFVCFLDKQGTPVVAGERMIGDRRQLEFAVAVPVLRRRPDGEKLEELAGYRELVVSDQATEAPILLVPREGQVRLMPFGKEEFRNGFTFGYVGAGPSNTASAISSFHEALGVGSKELRERVGHLVRSSPQGQELRISSERFVEE